MSINICQFCKSKTKNPKFCSKSCAAKLNNTINPKRKLQNTCVDCGKPITRSRTRCKEDYLLWLKNNQAKDMTLQEAIYWKHHKSSAFALVRSRARASEKMKKIKSCEICGYSKHVQACHKKPISSFSLDTKISIINENDNIMCLCPNCHWEYDHGLL